MDHYTLLKVPSNAKQVEIDRAYQKLIKEARYDTSINRRDVEAAYKTLSDPTQRALYDAARAEAGKIKQASLKIQKKEVSEAARFRRLIVMFCVTFVLLLVYYGFRYGYYIKSFDSGDNLYFADTGRYFGQILMEDPDHVFGKKPRPAYLVKTPDETEVWFPASDIKTLCVKNKK